MLKIFIDRPVLSSVISIVIVLMGVIGLNSLPIEQYPNIATPTIMVSASYPGANAETLQKSVIVPLEEAINGVQDMLYMTSSASNAGGASITVYFKQGTDPDMATVNVQNRVARATGQLPAEVLQIGVTTSKRQTSTLQIFSVYGTDDTYDYKFIANYVRINIVPEILRISGVGEARAFGPDYSMRIWLKPDVMAQYGLIPADIQVALGEQNIESSTGYFGENSENTFSYTMKYTGRLETTEQFEQIVIKALPSGEILYLKDVATIELGATSYTMIGEATGHPGVNCMINQVAGSNANEINIQIDKLLEEIEKDLPTGIKIHKILNTKDFLDASIYSVTETLLVAILLVILVVFFFLQSFRATLIPLVGIIVSVVGTFALLSVFGFTINLLTLFALVLAIGIVVDDAVIVVEAVQTKFDQGYKSPYKATVEGMGNITSAIIGSTLVFMSVFIPVSFMGGTSGIFFTQFGLTMAVAVGISAINALTLSPALCAIFLTPHAELGEKLNLKQRFRKSFDTSFHTMTDKYTSGLKFLIRKKWLVRIGLLGAVVALVLLMGTTKSGFVPQEDQGIMYINVTTSPGSTLSETRRIIDKIDESIKDVEQIEFYGKLTGFNWMYGESPTVGIFFVRLKPWDERKGKENNVDAVMAQIYAKTAHIKEARIFLSAPPQIAGYGSGNGFELFLQDRKGSDINEFFAIAQQYIAKLNERPEIGRAYTSFDVRYPQYWVEVDAAQCKRAGIAPNDVLRTLAGYYGGMYASDFNQFSKMYRVMVQSSPEYRLDEESLNNTFVRVGGEMAPISRFVTLTKTNGAEVLNRFNMFNSISVNGTPAEGYSSSDAINAIREVAAESLPTGYGYEFGGITREEAGSGNNIVIIMGICILLVYLVLSALYESFLIPLAVICAVPVGLMGSFFFTKIFGLENNIYLQTGVIMLIGMLAKTAILITGYASERRKEGMTIVEAAISASRERFRPILMTALAMIFGLLPLVFASGVGANGNISLGVGTVGGMFIGTIALLFVVPVMFTVFQYIQEKIFPSRNKQENESAK